MLTLLSPEERKRLEEFEVRKARGLPIVDCVQCGEAFTALNVFTPAGARETQISGLCEKCFDALLEEGEE